MAWWLARKAAARPAGPLGRPVLGWVAEEIGRKEWAAPHFLFLGKKTEEWKRNKRERWIQRKEGKRNRREVFVKNIFSSLHFNLEKIVLLKYYSKY